MKEIEYNLQITNGVAVTQQTGGFSGKSKVFCPFFYLDNRDLPVFVPLLADQAFLWYNNLGTTQTYINNATLDANSLRYFINYRDPPTGACYTIFLKWDNQYNPGSSVGAFEGIVPEVTPYYWCFNFQTFLDYISVSIRDLYYAAGQPTAANTILSYNSDSFSLVVPYDQYAEIEFSNDLLNILPFASTPGRTPGAQVVQFANTIKTINSVNYVLANAPLYDTVYPYDQFILSTNLEIENTTVVTNIAQSLSTPVKYPIVFKFNKVTTSLDVYNFFVATDTVNEFNRKTLRSADVPNGQVEWYLLARVRRTGTYIRIENCKKIRFALNLY